VYSYKNFLFVSSGISSVQLMTCVMSLYVMMELLKSQEKMAYHHIWNSILSHWCSPLWVCWMDIIAWW